jgi:hypothetical protein
VLTSWFATSYKMDSAGVGRGKGVSRLIELAMRFFLSTPKRTAGCQPADGFVRQVVGNGRQVACSQPCGLRGSVFGS